MRILFGALCVFLCFSAAKAEVYVVGGGEFGSRSIEIVQLGELHPNGRLPIIYVFDKENNFTITKGVIEILQWSDLMPPVLLVGVSTGSRFNDFTPTQTKDAPDNSGGADLLINYIDDALRPYLSERYVISPFEVLHGHSLSGLFVLHAMLEDPGQFNGVIAVGPSAWWDNEEIADRAERKCKGEKQRLFLSLSVEKDSRSGTQRIAQACRLAGSTFGEVKFKEYPRENHLTAVTPSTHDGLRFVFEPWNMEALFENRDMAAVEARLKQLEKLTNGAPFVDVSGMAEMARSFTREGQPEAAAKILERANALAPGNIKVMNYLGEAYREAGAFEKACQIFLRSHERASEIGHPMVRWIDRQIINVGLRTDCKRGGD